MNKRLLTVGSLIPKNIVAERVVTPSPAHTKYTEKHHQNKICLLQNEVGFEIEPVKGNLLDTALDQGQALQYKCRKGTCGVCTVKVMEGASNLSSPNEKEKKKLKNSLEGGYRLACQAEIH